MDSRHTACSSVVRQMAPHEPNASATKAEDLLRHDNQAFRLRNEAVQQLVYATAHDLRSPLITIEGYLRQLERVVAAGRVDRLSELTAPAVRAAAQMRGRIDALVMLAELEQTPVKPSPVDVEALVADLLKALAPEIERLGVIVELAASLPPVVADPLLLRQAFGHLLDNALKHGQGGAPPKITIGGSVHNDETLYFVSDNGQGIPDNRRESVFTSFTRLDKARSGVGVGLALVKRIIERHGGRVWVEAPAGQSLEPGVHPGTAFWISLPLHTASE